MPLALIPQRTPTVAELAPYLEVWDGRIVADVAHRRQIVRLVVELCWQADTKRKDPNAFLVPFAGSVPDYNAYLRSPRWRDIRGRKLAAEKHVCECCGHRATQVHHRDYRPRVLAGEDLSPLVALCGDCHQFVEYDDTGRQQRDAWQDKERALAELMGAT